MTAQELRAKLNKMFDDLEKPVPKELKIDEETFKNVLFFIFMNPSTNVGFPSFIEIMTGKHGGLMFKGVELLLDKD